MPQRTSIKIVNGALDDTPSGEIVLRGVIDPANIGSLKVADYQREILSPKKIDQLVDALTQGGVPDIVLGMRGEEFIERDGAVYLQNDVFIIDGLQRQTAALRILEMDPNSRPHLGATIHFGTTDVSEREMFEKLNLGQTTLSGNVTLRNMQAKVQVMQHLFKLTEDKGFVLCGLVCWGQNMTRGQLITATTYVRTVGMLHSHAGAGRGGNIVDLANNLQKIMENVGRNVFLANNRAYFDFIDRCWGIRRVTYKNGASFLKANFLRELARVFSDHSNFWKDGRLTIDTPTMRKIAQFPIDDPEVMRLASSSGAASAILYQLLVNHINSGKRTRRLELRRGVTPQGLLPEEDDDTPEGDDES